jgi:hypothetical protein
MQIWVRAIPIKSTIPLTSRFFVAFVSSKLFNSSTSVLEFIKQNATQKEKLLSAVKKRLYELLAEFLEMRK